jgi:hypothetical protein
MTSTQIAYLLIIWWIVSSYQADREQDRRNRDERHPRP